MGGSWKGVELAHGGSGTTRATPSSFVMPAHSEIPTLSSEQGKQRSLLWDIPLRMLNKDASTWIPTFKTFLTGSWFLVKGP